MTRFVIADHGREQATNAYLVRPASAMISDTDGQSALDSSILRKKELREEALSEIEIDLTDPGIQRMDRDEAAAAADFLRQPFQRVPTVVEGPEELGPRHVTGRIEITVGSIRSASAQRDAMTLPPADLQRLVAEGII